MRKINKTRAYLVRCPLVHPPSCCTPVVGVVDVVSVLRFEVVGVLPPYRIPSECRGVVVSIASGASGPPSCVSSERGVVEAKKTLRLAFEQQRGGGGQTPPPLSSVSSEGGVVGVKRRWWCQKTPPSDRLAFRAREGWCGCEKHSAARKLRWRLGIGTANPPSRISSEGGVCCQSRNMRKIENIPFGG